MIQKRYLTIISSERTTGTTSDFNISVRHGIKYNNCMLIMAMIPNTYYNITDMNNGILLDEVLYTMPNGNYNLDEFFNAFINLSPLITAITYDDIIGKITITCSPSTFLSFPINGSMHSVLGFDRTYSDNLTTHISTYPPSLSKYNLYIEIDQLSSNHTTTNNISGSYTYEITNNANKNDILQYYYKTHYPQISNCKNHSDTMYNLNIKLKNQYNEILQGLAEWTIILCFC